MTNSAKTNAERQRDYRARKAAERLTEVRGIMAHPDDHQAVKDEAAKIVRRRQRAEKRKPSNDELTGRPLGGCN